MPKISVIMGVYNGSKVVKNSINSILSQTYTDFEIIVCDDASTDNSSIILEDLASLDDRIVLLKNKSNLKLAGTLNKCLAIATGEYIARMDDDDRSHPLRFEKQVAFLDQNIEYSIVGSSRNMYDADGVWGSDIRDGECDKVDIFLGKSFIHPSVMMRRDHLLEVGGYSDIPETLRTEDYDLWCKFYERGYKGFNLKDILLDYYEAKDSYGKRKYKFRICEYKLRKKWRKKLNLSSKYSFYEYRPLIVGLIPIRLLMAYHSKRFK